MALLQEKVSVPIRGLFNLTWTNLGMDYCISRLCVSVPIRGLFNLTNLEGYIYNSLQEQVSVPIRGLFNLTILKRKEQIE